MGHSHFLVLLFRAKLVDGLFGLPEVAALVCGINDEA